MRNVLPGLLALACSLLFAVPAAASPYPLENVPTIVSAADAAKLAKAGIKTSDDLLAKAAKAKDRKVLAKSSGLKPADLLGLARRADLLRISGVGPEMVLLLEAAGIRTAAELGKKEPAALMKAVDEANASKKLSAKPPTEPQLQFWIAEAKKLQGGVEEK